MSRSSPLALVGRSSSVLFLYHRPRVIFYILYILTVIPLANSGGSLSPPWSRCGRLS